MEFNYKNTCLISDREIKSGKRLLIAEIARIKAALSRGYHTEYASVNLPGDAELLKNVESLIKKKKKLNPKLLVVIGIGGSNLGTIAVHEAVNGVYHNEKSPPIKVYFPDTVDDDKISDLLAIAEASLKRGENIIVNVVTKTGRTTETAALFETFVNLLKKYKKDHIKYVVATTDRGSKLWHLAKKMGYDLLEIPRNVGGRYSVFSAVGLFPLGLLGLDIYELRRGASDMLKICTEDYTANPAAISAFITYWHIRNKRNINDLFIFSSDLEAIGRWHRQLMGESIGKELDRSGKMVQTGMTPTVSIGSTDLHSMAQLYLGGPQDKLTTFIRVQKNKHRVVVPKDGGQLAEHISGKDLSMIMDAIFCGVKIAFLKAKRPFTEIILPDKSEYSIAQLLQFKMIEMMYLGSLLGVNPFDQPNVEAYKKEMQRILSKC